VGGERGSLKEKFSDLEKRIVWWLFEWDENAGLQLSVVMSASVGSSSGRCKH